MSQPVTSQLPKVPAQDTTSIFDKTPLTQKVIQSIVPDFNKVDSLLKVIVIAIQIFALATLIIPILATITALVIDGIGATVHYLKSKPAPETQEPTPPETPTPGQIKPEKKAEESQKVNSVVSTIALAVSIPVIMSSLAGYFNYLPPKGLLSYASYLDLTSYSYLDNRLMNSLTDNRLTNWLSSFWQKASQ